MSINVRSNDPMEVTVTKTCLEVLNNLAKVGSRGGFYCGFKIWEYENGLFELQNTFLLTNCYNFIILLNFYINYYFLVGGLESLNWMYISILLFLQICNIHCTISLSAFKYFKNLQTSCFIGGFWKWLLIYNTIYILYINYISGIWRCLQTCCASRRGREDPVTLRHLQQYGTTCCSQTGQCFWGQ